MISPRLNRAYALTTSWGYIALILWVSLMRIQIYRIMEAEMKRGIVEKAVWIFLFGAATLAYGWIAFKIKAKIFGR